MAKPIQKPKSSGRLGRLSLYPLQLEDALRGAMLAKLPQNDAEPRLKKKSAHRK